jgi:hypothetical protein
MHERWLAWLATLTPAERRRWRQRIAAERIETLGLAAFFHARHPGLRPPIVLAPVTAHYSWSKGMKLLGLGRASSEPDPRDRGMRTRSRCPRGAAAVRAGRRQPVLMVVGVLGSTEFGTIDPIDALVAARDRHGSERLRASACTSMPPGAATWRPCSATRRLAARLPDARRLPPVPDAGRACRFRRARSYRFGHRRSAQARLHRLRCRRLRLPRPPRDGLLAERRRLRLHGEGGDYFKRFRQLGRYIPEGSKAGANAAAVYVTHRVLPLDHAHFGQLQRQTIRNAEAFVAALGRFALAQQARVRVAVPYPPDSNLVCIALNPLGNRDVAVMNAYVRRLYEALRVDPGTPLQVHEFFASMTTLHPDLLGPEDTTRVLAELDLDPETLRSEEPGADKLVILRHTLMNPFLIDRENGISYIERYLDFLARRL